LSLVVIGDSIPYNDPFDCPGCTGFVDHYADALAKATGLEVTTSNLSQHNSLSLPMLMDELEDSVARNASGYIFRIDGQETSDQQGRLRRPRVPDPERPQL
jgi:hypothetical protein